MKYEHIIETTEGIHARIAESLVRASQKFTCRIYLQYEEKIVDAKSILGLISLVVPEGEDVRLIAKGNQAEEALKQIVGEIKSFKIK
jgi:phosphocarrier protein HPr